MTGGHGSMEGKEVRLGIPASAMWAEATTVVSNGSVNAMHDSFSPLGGMVPHAEHHARGDHLRRRRGRDVRHARLRLHHGVLRRADGGPNARVSGQEDRDPGGPALRPRGHRADGDHPFPCRRRHGDKGRPRLAQQPGAAWALGDPLRVLVDHRQQRERVRGAGRQHGLTTT